VCVVETLQDLQGTFDRTYVVPPLIFSCFGNIHVYCQTFINIQSIIQLKEGGTPTLIWSIYSLNAVFLFSLTCSLWHWLANRLNILHENNRVGWAVELAGATFDANRDVYMGLCIPFGDRIGFTTGHTGTAQNAILRNNVGH
jgi:hypothetical protein